MSIEELPPDAPIPDGVANDEDKSEMSVSEPPESPKAGEGEAGLLQGNTVQPQKVYSRNLVGDLPIRTLCRAEEGEEEAIAIFIALYPLALSALEFYK